MEREEDLPDYCAICMVRTSTAQVGFVCGHHFCKTCLSRWMTRSTTCPACRTVMLPRVELPVTAKETQQGRFVRRVCLSARDSLAGFTVASRMDDSNRIIRILRDGEMYRAGFRVSDTIDTINGVLCKSPRHITDMVNVAQKYRVDIFVGGKARMAFLSQVRISLLEMFEGRARVDPPIFE